MKNAAMTIDEYLAALPEWQASKLKNFRLAIHESGNGLTEEIKWGVPAFVIDAKTIFTMAAFKGHVKYNFILNGALLQDTDALFNNGLESKKSRAIDLSENQSVNMNALKKLIGQSLDKR